MNETFIKMRKIVNSMKFGEDKKLFVFGLILSQVLILLASSFVLFFILKKTGKISDNFSYLYILTIFSAVTLFGMFLRSKI